MRRIIAIDGGGIRGLIPALVLAEIERRSARRVADLADLVAGTSTGGILALALTMPGDDGAPRYHARDLVDLYVREGPHIFSRSLLHRITSLEGTVEEKYPASGMDAVFRRYFGDARLRDALTPMLVTAYETQRRSPFLFRSARARTDPAYDYPLAAVARATSAAPTYFEPELVRNDATGEEWSLIDGGVVAVNPAGLAYAEALSQGVAGGDVLLLSLGTGSQQRPLSYAEIKGWGELEWARPIIDVIFDGSAAALDFELTQELAPQAGAAQRYWRLQTDLRSASDHLDDASPENLERLQGEARRLIADHDAEIDAACAALTASLR